MGRTPRALKQKRRGGDQEIFVPGDGELRPRPGKLTVAIVGHSVHKLAIRDPSLAEDLDLSQLRILWLVRCGLNWGKLRKFVVP